MSEQPEIHNKVFSQFSDDRIEAAKQLGTFFEVLPDRKQAFEDLLRLCSDGEDAVREKAINSLVTVFPNVPDRKLAWDKFVNLTAYPVESVMTAAANALVSVFSLMQDKNKAWENLAGLINSRSSMEDANREIVSSLNYIIKEVPDKGQVWKDLLKMGASEYPYVREKSALLLNLVFPELADGEKEKAWNEVLELASESVDEKIREQATRTLGVIYTQMPEEMKDETLETLLELAVSGNPEVQKEALLALPPVFFHIPDKKKAWNDIIKLTGDENEYVRKQAIDALVFIFPEMPDKKKIWADFLNLAKARDDYIRNMAADALVSLFSGLDNKASLCEELIELSGNEDEAVQSTAVNILTKAFPHISCKREAYSKLVRLAETKDSPVLRKVVSKLTSAYPELCNIPEVSEREWEEIRKRGVQDKTWKSNSGKLEKPWGEYESKGDRRFEKKGKFRKEKSGEKENVGEKEKTGEQEKSGEKEETGEKEKPGSLQFYEKEHRKPVSNLFKKPVSDNFGLEVESRAYIRRKDMTDLFAGSGSGLSGKEEAVSKLINLISDPDPQRRRGAIESLLTAYSRYTGKTQDIWNELLNLTGEEETDTRRDAADLLSEVFPVVEEKSTVFFDLVKLTESQEAHLRRRATELLASAFAYCEDKQAAWNELVRLVSVEDREVRKGAILALSSGYIEVPDKEKAWKDLLSFSDHSDSFVQREATRALGPAFFYVPDKTQAWRDLKALTDNPYVYVRRYALRSLGRASLWRALRAENEATYIFGLKEAVNYLEEASKASIGFHIPEFYHPFYQALLFILFSDRPGIAKVESERYLSKMTDEVREQTERQKLLEIFEQFSELLTRAGRLSPGDLSGQKKLLKTSILLLDQFSGFFDNKEEMAIFAQKTVKKEKPVKKEYSNLGKALLERVEKKKASLTKDRKKKNF
ncbi:hypothetical protein A9239_09990 [Methanosarcina sp. A14]|uniref:Uncharacterized protein n=2 Tax=Methanosarcina barkeri TaxID=2208 RepID=A0A0E3LNJ5_METBA|nr:MULTISPECIES: HEAT repeat domain-containing protein [Methanosarcina]AKB54881.1 hypothetical protein MSBRM_1883 [Methanosarcina barkeri MS]OED07489.1 hypothetical protein A9239_09990 [Methanosarcina sp. A14]